MNELKFCVACVRPKDFVPEHVLRKAGRFGQPVFESLDGTLLIFEKTLKLIGNSGRYYKQGG